MLNTNMDKARINAITADVTTIIYNVILTVINDSLTIVESGGGPLPPINFSLPYQSKS